MKSNLADRLRCFRFIFLHKQQQIVAWDLYTILLEHPEAGKLPDEAVLLELHISPLPIFPAQRSPASEVALAEAMEVLQAEKHYKRSTKKSHAVS